MPSRTLEEAFDMSRKLFALPLDDKMKAPHPPTPRPHRGYSHIGRENAAAKGILDTNDEGRRERLRGVTDYKVSFPPTTGNP